MKLFNSTNDAQAAFRLLNFTPQPLTGSSSLSFILQAPLIFYFHAVYDEVNGFLVTMQRYRIACFLKLQ